MSGNTYWILTRVNLSFKAERGSSYNDIILYIEIESELLDFVHSIGTSIVEWVIVEANDEPIVKNWGKVCK